MKKTLARAALLGAVAATAVATPAVAAPPEGGSANAQCAAGATLPWGAPFPSKTSCITFLNTGKLTGTSYVAQCRVLSAEMGGYPITFYGQFTANNAGQCLNILRSFPHEAPPEAPAA
jgi:hypothetical protein